MGGGDDAQALKMAMPSAARMDLKFNMMFSFRFTTLAEYDADFVPNRMDGEIRKTGTGIAVSLLKIFQEIIMLTWALFFFVVSLVAGVLGFTNIAAGARGIAKILFFIAITLFLLV